METSCMACPYDNQTMHTIELNDEQFKMLKWVIDCEKNRYDSILKTCSPEDLNNGCYVFAVILKWLINLDNVLKNS